ncbi:beta-N-acetylhexosaminidase [Tenacibaculum sp. SZ-18]|uniref:beta-N-acetylhexosaminidase n=1 Tax=Tenacibaculum sp. SZ-18 TaxID=754423 RepID=UPI000C2D67D7|nr:family 20 glycosylhydrolase [Tenacibaculum sp. SZ-18]AUC14744.1 beta-N-acetylhexosaminidase [Tenacibaculum sp. SZ-18]
MKILNYILPVLFLLTFFQCKKEQRRTLDPAVIPIPAYQEIKNGFFILSNETFISGDDNLLKVINYFKSYLETNLHIKPNTSSENNSINFIIDKAIKNNEEYHLSITEKDIQIKSKTAKGAFYGVQTLLQLLPSKSNSKEIAIQSIKIKDKPEFAYRGMHLDVARHMFPVAFIKKYIDVIASLKYNTFHWHLTEDQGWRIEIKKYPKLQEIAAFRGETLIGHYNDQPQEYDGKRYGGYYTQEEIKEIVQYASERYVEIIPEIEMPGHSQAAITAYPELGCTGEKVEVATKWGVFDEVYCPSETTFKFLEDVIDEVVELFPGKYIHIGGDETPKTKWKNSAFCQQLIKQKNLKNEHGLQSYFIKRMEKYINSKGKQIIGWDEILEGGLAPNATVMSWRGTEGAVQAAKEHHNVILTPLSHCYFDYYQSENENEPLAIGGFLPLEKVYSFNPIPEELTEEESKYVLGAQGNVWTEYIKTPEKVEYMAFPRAIALAEVLWSKPEHKNFIDFKNRLIQFQERLRLNSVNFANHLYEITGNFARNDDNKLMYSLSSATKDAEIRYTLNDKNPTGKSTIYTKPINISKTTKIKAASFHGGNQISHIHQNKINLHKAVGKTIALSVEPNESYNAGGKQALINGISGSNKRYGDKEWLGFFGNDVTITIDLDSVTTINSIKTRFYNGNGQWIYAPKQLTIKFDNTEKQTFNITNEGLLVNFHANFENAKTKTIKIEIPNFGVIPKGKQGGGYRAWTFIDEILIE